MVARRRRASPGMPAGEVASPLASPAQPHAHRAPATTQSGRTGPLVDHSGELPRACMGAGVRGNPGIARHRPGSVTARSPEGSMGWRCKLSGRGDFTGQGHCGDPAAGPQRSEAPAWTAHVSMPSPVPCSSTVLAGRCGGTTSRVAGCPVAGGPANGTDLRHFGLPPTLRRAGGDSVPAPLAA
jgi:hypothetical protein